MIDLVRVLARAPGAVLVRLVLQNLHAAALATALLSALFLEDQRRKKIYFCTVVLLFLNIFTPNLVERQCKNIAGETNGFKIMDKHLNFYTEPKIYSLTIATLSVSMKDSMTLNHK